MEAYADAGIGNVLMSFNNGLHNEARVNSARKSLNLFPKEVMPRFQMMDTPQIHWRSTSARAYHEFRSASRTSDGQSPSAG